MITTKNKSRCLLATLPLLALAIVGCGHSQVEKETSSANKKSCASSTPGCIDGRLLHVPSPDWRDQIIYSILVDRFNDGDPSRNDQGSGEYAPEKPSHYSGGDIQGVTDKVEYIKELGATAVWLTPVLANQWWDPTVLYSGYHGYWPVSFKHIDQHFGSLDDYKNLSDSLHRNSMYLIKDAVVNQVAHFYHYDGEYNPNDRTENFKLNTQAIPPKPVMLELDMFNILNPEHAKADLYHWTPPIKDYTDPNPEVRLTHQLELVNDLNTSNPTVRKILKESYSYWIKEVGIDGYRFDAAKYVEHDFWNDFLHSADGIYEAAAVTGRQDFLTMGEVYNISKPLETSAEKEIISYLGTPEKPELRTLIGFPLFSEMTQVFNYGKPTSYLSFRLNAHMEIYPDPHMVPNFINNHDTQRFLAGGNVDGWKQALAVLMTMPGIPILFQGDEQGLAVSRQAMFEGGYLSDKDRFDQNSEMFQYIRSLAHLRRAHKLFTRGALEIIADTPRGPGAFAYKRTFKQDVAFVLINTSDHHATLLNQIPTGLAAGQQLKPLFTSNISIEKDILTGPGGHLTLTLPARSALVLSATDKVFPIKQTHEIVIDENYEGEVLNDDTLLTGTISQPNVELKLVINGNVDYAQTFYADATGKWQTTLPIKSYGEHQNQYEIFSEALNIASQSYYYHSKVPAPAINISASDPLFDDKGRNGNYSAPTHHTMSGEMDIRAVNVKSGGSILQLDIVTRDTSDIWAPMNEFDHAVFNIFFDFPDTDGLSVLPELNDDAPAGFTWNLAHIVHGYGNSVYRTEGATAEQAGKKESMKVNIAVDHDNKTLSLTYDGESMGIKDWAGTKIYISTWDVDNRGSYRMLAPEASEWIFGGGGMQDSLILDEVLIEIPATFE